MSHPAGLNIVLLCITIMTAEILQRMLPARAFRPACLRLQTGSLRYGITT